MTKKDEEIFKFMGKVDEKLDNISGDVAAIKEHLKTLNGKVAKHENFLWYMKGVLKYGGVGGVGVSAVYIILKQVGL